MMFFLKASYCVCICYFWKFDMCLSLYLSVWRLPEGMFAQHGGWSTAGLQGFFWEQVRDEKRESTRCPPCTRTSTESHPGARTHLHAAIWVENKLVQTLFNIFCYSSRKKKKERKKILLCTTFAGAKYTIPQLFESLRFPEMPVWHELKIRELCSR